MTTTLVSTAAAFQSALNSAHAGDTIELAPGNYADVYVSNVNVAGGAVTITSQNAANPAVLSYLQVESSSGLKFSGLDVVGTGAPNWYAYVDSSSNVSFSNMLFEGSNPVPSNNGGGMGVVDSSGISVTSSTFEQLGGAACMGVASDNNVTVAGNAFFNMAGDGMDVAGTSNITVSSNSFTDFVYPTGFHPDAIQFWNAGTTGSAQNITISDNVITRGAGETTQGIFIEDDNNSGAQPYLNLNISGNTLVGIPYNAILIEGPVESSIGAVVTGNTVQAYNDYTSWISVSESVNPTVTNNAAVSFGYTNSSGVAQSGNTTLAAIAPPSPSLTNAGAAGSYHAGGAAVDIAPSLAVADYGSTVLKSASVAITGGFLAGDALNFANQNGITGSYNASTGVLTLSGFATLANYQAALESITFSSSASDPTLGGTATMRTITFTGSDGLNGSNTLAAPLNVSAAQSTGSPSLSNSGAAVTYAAGGAAADIAHALGVTDPGSTTLASAQVAITGGFLAGDALNFANQGGITGSYNASTGVLTLTGSASLAAYQTALESITYSSSALDPTFNPTIGSYGAPDAMRTVSFAVNDGANTSHAVSVQMAVALQAATSSSSKASSAPDELIRSKLSAPPMAVSVPSVTGALSAGTGHILEANHKMGALALSLTSGLDAAPAADELASGYRLGGPLADLASNHFIYPSAAAPVGTGIHASASQATLHAPLGILLANPGPGADHPADTGSLPTTAYGDATQHGGVLTPLLGTHDPFMLHANWI